ncbi:MAG: hypothetical protein DRR19_06140 [Candidatus Parabeggiatoa sp. nov. 1]|nr:MAG: hypothetical protein DRR19_06140 [Gammaproteobacteria bacterium]
MSIFVYINDCRFFDEFRYQQIREIRQSFVLVISYQKINPSNPEISCTGVAWISKATSARSRKDPDHLSQQLVAKNFLRAKNLARKQLSKSGGAKRQTLKGTTKGLVGFSLFPTPLALGWYRSLRDPALG